MKALAIIGGVLLVLVALFLGLYIGVWTCLIGGILQGIPALLALEGGGIAWALVKIFVLAPFVRGWHGWSALAVVLP